MFKTADYKQKDIQKNRKRYLQVTDKGLISKTYKQLNIFKKKIQKWVKRSKEIFLQRRHR